MSVASEVSVTAAEGMVHPLHFIFQQCCGHQGPSVGMSFYGQSFLTGVSSHIHEPVIGSAVPGLEVGLGVEPKYAGWAPSQFLPWHCGEPLTLEAFFDRVQDLLVNTCSCLLITEHPPQQTL